MAYEVQQAIIDVLIKKTIKAAKDFSARGGSASGGKIKTIILGGGVSANYELRRQLDLNIKNKIPSVKFLVPSANLSTDNGLMVAVAGYFLAKHNKIIKWQDLEAKANLRVE